MKLPAFARIREVGPRDGFQSLKTLIPTDQKLEIIKAVVAAGVLEVETTSFASTRALPQFHDAAELMAKVPRGRSVYSAMVFNEKGARKAVAAKADRLVVVVSASEAHSRANVKRGIAESLANLEGIFEAAREEGVPVTGAVAVAFGCPFQGDVTEAEVFGIAEAFFSAGADGVILADTTGMATPDRVERSVKGFQDRFPKGALVLHFHNNRGTAMANLFSALLAGATTFDTALGGIGGCPYVPKAAGNIPTEDAVFMLEEMGVETGIELGALLEAARRLEAVVDHPLPGQVMKSGPRLAGTPSCPR